MITYKTVKTEEDAKLVKEFCAENNLLNPLLNGAGTAFIAIDKEGKIVGVCGLKTVVQIEPLIAQNPIVAHILSEKAITSASLITNQVVAVTKDANESFIGLLETYGFEVTDRNMTMLRRGV